MPLPSPPPPAPLESEEQHPLDRELVARTQAGDPTAFDILVERYKQRLYAVIYNMTLNHADANDLLMETLMKAYRSIHGYQGHAAFYTWIYRIGVNRTINFLQRNKQRHNISLEEAAPELEKNKDLIENQDIASPERRINLEELQKKLNESLLKLSEAHRAVVTLADIQGLSHAEIAKIINCSEGTIKSRLFYARKQLQKYLKPYV